MNPEEEIKLLEDIVARILQALEETISSGEELPDELQGMIAEELMITTQRIDQLRTQTETPLTPTPELQQGEYPSSQINAFNYDDKTGKLFVKFQGDYPQQNGPVYSYEGVPKFIFDVFKRGAVGPQTSGSNAWHTWKRGVTPSLGAAMNALIKKGGYNYQRLK